MTAPSPTWVIKYGGNAMTDANARARVLADVRALAPGGIRPLLVHGGGPYIEQALALAGVESTVVRGLRVTTPASLAVIEPTLTMLGKRLAAELGNAVGLTGRDARLLVAARVDPELGEVGTVTRVRLELLEALLDAGFTPVIACLAVDEGGAPLNVNADDVAGGVAAALRAPCVFLTNVAGVLDDPADAGSRLPTLDREEVRARVEDGRVAGGMIPKVEAALAALARGAPSAVIADGRVAGELERVRSGAAGTRIVP
ncbi:MAG: acetylglutamate kinase [Trueperaceae bacterium]|nr:acetylglutamate kinase [Trueperaceae bacterium]